MKKQDIAHLRLANQGIALPEFKKPEQVVDWLVAVQAQDFAGSKWALGLRMQDATDSFVEKAFNEGAILRTHVMRPTWHYVSPTDIRWLLALTALRVHQINASMYRRFELDSATFKRSNDALTKALQGNKQLTRDELRDVLRDVGIRVDDNLRMILLLMYAELEGILCSGGRCGKQFTYALLEECAPQARELERGQALAELAGRYFKSRGPATVHDFERSSFYRNRLLQKPDGTGKPDHRSSSRSLREIPGATSRN
jgi:DNA glycosylase AlkZ-like